jgi:hypothetical protein
MVSMFNHIWDYDPKLLLFFRRVEPKTVCFPFKNAKFWMILDLQVSRSPFIMHDNDCQSRCNGRMAEGSFIQSEMKPLICTE